MGFLIRENTVLAQFTFPLILASPIVSTHLQQNAPQAANETKVDEGAQCSVRYSRLCEMDHRKQQGKKTNDMLSLDTSVVSTDGSVDDKVKLNEKMTTAIKEALIGYARFDFVENFDQIRWRQWNERQVNHNKATLMRNSFLLNGMDRFNPAHAIPLVVKATEVIQDAFVKAPTHVREELPIVRFGGSAENQNGVKAAGGQHRVAAMKLWIETQQARMRELEHEISIIKKRSADVEDVDIDVWAHNERLKPQLQSMLNLLACGGEWIVTLFDEGKYFIVSFLRCRPSSLDKLDDSLLHRLARNETNFVYSESGEEGLVQRYKEAVAEQRTWVDIAQSKPDFNQGNAVKHYDILSQQYGFEVVGLLTSAYEHYLPSKLLSLAKFHSTMQTSYAGVRIFYSISAIAD